MSSAPTQPSAPAAASQDPRAAAARGPAARRSGRPLVRSRAATLLLAGCSLALAGLALSGLAACKGRPPIEASSGLRTAPALTAQAPSDIAILQVEDATATRGFGALDPGFRRSLSEVLVERGYAPLAADHVDELLRQSGQAGTGSPVDADWLGSVRGTFAADAVLGLRLTRWDTADVALSTPRVGFSMEVLMISSETGERLWWGTFEGSLKPGGERTAPLGREERIRAAADTLARTLGAELERRRVDPGTVGNR